MLIIFEGSDLSGKSTIAEAVAKKLPESYLTKMCHRPKNNSESEVAKVYKRYWNIVEWYKLIYTLSQGKDTMILDRFYPSEAVYSYKRDYDAMDDKRIIELDTYIDTQFNALIVYCEPPNDILEQRLKDRGDDFVDVNDLGKIRSRYHNFLEFTCCQVITYNTEDGLPDWPIEVDAKDSQIWIKDFLWRTTEELCESREAAIQNHETHKIEELIDAVHFLTECFILTDLHPTIDLKIMGDNASKMGSEFGTYDKHMAECIYFLGLVGNTLKNKKWKQTAVLTDMSKFHKYLDSAYYHLLSCIFACKCTPHDLYNFYFKKSEVNKFRQRSNY